MDNTKRIKLELSTKILLSLFNFFAPISIVFLVVLYFESYNINATICSIISILIGLFCLIFNLIKYNKFLCINEQTLTVCKGKFNSPQVEQIINVKDITSKISDREISVKVGKKRIKLLHVFPSIIGLVCLAGPLILIPMVHSMVVMSQKSLEIYEIIPSLFKKQPIKRTKFEFVLIDVIAWIFVLFVCLFGVLGIIYTPFYLFIG